MFGISQKAGKSFFLYIRDFAGISWRCPKSLSKNVFNFWPLILRDAAVLSLRYPTSRDTVVGKLALPQNGAIPPLVLIVIHRNICAIPYFATYRAILVRYPIKQQARKSFAIPPLQVSRDIKSIAAGLYVVTDYPRKVCLQNHDTCGVSCYLGNYHLQ